MQQCPKCGYVRKHSDINPNNECPRCGVIYTKYKKKPIKEDINQLKDKNESPNFRKWWQKRPNQILIFFMGLLLIITAIITNVKYDFPIELLLDYENKILEPFLVQSNQLGHEENKVFLSSLKHSLELTPPVVIVTSQLLNSKISYPSVQPEIQSKIPRKYRAFSARDAKTIIFWSKWHGSHAFDIPSGGYRGSTKSLGENTIASLVTEAVQKDTGWVFDFSAQDIIKIGQRLRQDQQRHYPHAFAGTLKIPLLFFWSSGKDGRAFFKYVWDKFQAKNPEEIEALIYAEIITVSERMYSPNGSSVDAVAMQTQNGFFHIYNPNSLEYLGSCSIAAKLLPNKIIFGASSHININDAIDYFSKFGCTFSENMPERQQ